MSSELKAENYGSGTETDPYQLDFKKWIYQGEESNVEDGLSGIYCFYSVWKDKENENCFRLLYIGKALDLKKRFKQHANPPEGLNASGKVEIDNLDDYLCDPDKAERKCFYAYARLDGRSLRKCEAAMIKQFQPVINIKAKKSLGCHDESYFKIEGQYVYDVVQKGTYHVKKDNQ